MTPEEREALNAQAARLDGWTISTTPAGRWLWIDKDGIIWGLNTPDYWGDSHLWTPILERLMLKGWMPRYSAGIYVMADGTGAFWSGDTLAEAVLRLFAAIEGKV